MRISIPLLILIVLSAPAVLGQRRGLGLKMDDAKYLRLPRKSPNVLLKGDLPASFSLQASLPEIGDQGMDGTCVGWSAAYYMRTAMEASKLNMNQPAQITAAAFSPGWLYGQLAAGKNTGCTEGIFLEDALEVMKTKGAAFLSCAPGACDMRYAQCSDQALQYKIGDYATLFDPNDAMVTPVRRIQAIKSALVESRNAVLIGMLVPSSFMDATGDTWRPAANETTEHAIGGHSMAVVGYDDTSGTFLIANSWGKSWGSQGFIRVAYDDLIRFTKNAYQIYSEPVTRPTPEAIALKSHVDFLSGEGAMGVWAALTQGTQAADVLTYRMSRPYASGTRFKMQIHNLRQAYVYILASDQQNRVSALFPHQANAALTSAVVAANSTVLMPSPNDSFTLDDVTGEDYLVLFISKKELDVEDLTEKVKQAKGTIVEKAFAALGEDFIPSSQIIHEPGQVSFEVKGEPQGTVVPVLVQIVHQ